MNTDLRLQRMPQTGVLLGQVDQKSVHCLRGKKVKSSMFGATVDYWLLRPHDHNVTTEEEIERDHSAMQLDIQRAIRRIQKFLNCWRPFHLSVYPNPQLLTWM
jgi:hypothetical protein